MGKYDFVDSFVLMFGTVLFVCFDTTAPSGSGPLR